MRGIHLITVAAVAVVVLFAAIFVVSQRDDGYETVDNVDALYSKLEGGASVRLGSDIAFTEVHNSFKNGNWDLYVPQGVESRLDLGGHTLSFVSTWGIKVFGKLTITGDGYAVNSNPNNSVVLGAAGSSDALLVIDGGSYNNTGDSETVLARDGATVEIHSGTFTSKVPDVTYSNGCVLNIEDQSSSKIVVYGGTFIGYDPARGDNNTGRGTFVAEGCSSVDSGDRRFVVSKVA